MMPFCRAFAIAIFAIGFGTPAWAINDTIEEFYGTFAGTADKSVEGEASPRDLNVEIGPKDDGFTVAWSTQISKEDGSTKTNAYSIYFRSTKRDAIYKSGMKVDLFGKLVPLDPIQGDPFVWATIDDGKMTVYALLITDAGAYEMQTYERTLTDGGMDLKFSRVRDGVSLKEITASLKRIDG